MGGIHKMKIKTIEIKKHFLLSQRWASNFNQVLDTPDQNNNNESTNPTNNPMDTGVVENAISGMNIEATQPGELNQTTADLLSPASQNISLLSVQDAENLSVIARDLTNRLNQLTQDMIEYEAAKEKGISMTPQEFVKKVQEIEQLKKDLKEKDLDLFKDDPIGSEFINKSGELIEAIKRDQVTDKIPFLSNNLDTDLIVNFNQNVDNTTKITEYLRGIHNLPNVNFENNLSKISTPITKELVKDLYDNNKYFKSLLDRNLQSHNFVEDNGTFVNISVADFQNIFTFIAQTFGATPKSLMINSLIGITVNLDIMTPLFQQIPITPLNDAATAAMDRVTAAATISENRIAAATANLENNSDTLTKGITAITGFIIRYKKTMAVSAVCTTAFIWITKNPELAKLAYTTLKEMIGLPEVPAEPTVKPTTSSTPDSVPGPKGKEDTGNGQITQKFDEYFLMIRAWIVRIFGDYR